MIKDLWVHSWRGGKGRSRRMKRGGREGKERKRKTEEVGEEGKERCFSLASPPELRSPVR